MVPVLYSFCCCSLLPLLLMLLLLVQTRVFWSRAEERKREREREINSTAHLSKDPAHVQHLISLRGLGWRQSEGLDLGVKAKKMVLIFSCGFCWFFPQVRMIYTCRGIASKLIPNSWSLGG